MQNLAAVHLWGELVGALAYDSKTKISTFEYAPEWMNKGIEIAPLRMPLPNKKPNNKFDQKSNTAPTRKFQFTNLNSETYRGLPAIFADTLPDDFGNAVINAWLARNGRDINSFTAIERLLYTGNRGMGALEYQPAIADKNTRLENIDLSSLIEMAQNILDERNQLKTNFPLKHENDHAMSALFQVGTSAGGARAKALIAINADRTQIRSGQVGSSEGYEQYLLKFDGINEHKVDSEVFGDQKGFGRMEYAYYLMAVDAGINMSPSELLIDGDRAHFMTKRFDREGNIKHHYVSLCAMDHADYRKPGTYSYEQLFSVARQLKLPRKDAIEIYRRMVFNVVARNHDDHTKNFGFLLTAKEKQWRLSPAFDIAYSYKKDSPWVSSHQISLNTKRDNFTREDLLVVGALIGNFKKESIQIINEVTAVVSQWRNYSEQAGVFEGLSHEIEKNFRLKIV